MVGLNQNSNINNANTAATSIVTASGNNIGGLIGNNYSTSSNTYSITNSHALGSVKVNSTSSTSVGGLIAYNQNSNLSDVSASGDVTATGAAAYAGGLVAWNYDGSISNSTATGNVRANSTSTGSIALAGGLMGYNTGAISNSSATGDVSANATITHAGGLVGRNFGGSINIAYASGSVNGNDNVGGLVGSNDNGHIRNAYASGAVTGQNQVGGLVGSHAGTGSIAQTYAIGKVVGTGTDVGGLVGKADSITTVRSSFWDTQSTGVSTSAGGAGAKGVSTAQIQDLNTFKIAGWDIDDEGGTGKVWRIYSGQTAPLLRSFLTQKTIAAPADKTVTYDATQHSIAPLIGLDAHTLMAGSSTGTNAGIYTTSYYSGQQGYDFVGDRESTLTINKASLTAIANNDRKTYDAKAYAGGNGVSYSGFVGGETASVVNSNNVSYGGTSQGVVNAGDYVIDVSGLSADNYDITFKSGKLTVDKATLTLQAASDSRTYNGTVTSNGTVNVSGLFGADKVTGLSQSFDSRNAGSRDMLVNGGYVVADGNGGNNYDVVTHTASGNIAKAKLDAVTGVGALDRVYNGLLGVDLDYSQARIVGTLFGADQVSVAHTGTGTMANKRAGVNKQVNIQGLGLSGAAAGNYELSDNTAQTQVDINKASIGSVSGLKGIDRQVNGSNSVAIDVSGAHLSQVVAGDQVFVSSAQGSVANNQAGTHLVSITDIDLGGTDADNYEWDFAPTTTTVNIVAVPTVPPTVSPTVPPTVAPRPTPTVAFSSANPYQRAIDFDEDRLKNPLNGNPVQIEIIGNGVNTDGIQTLSGGLR